MQFWTIARADNPVEVLYPGFATPSVEDHPKDHGWNWDAAQHTAVPIDERPDPACQIWDGGAWVADLTVHKARCWATVKARRDLEERRGCASTLGRVDTDADSQRKIAGAVQMAMIAQAAGAPFEIVWTMQDNAEVAHDAAAMIAMGVAVGTHVNACHAAARALWAQIEAATDVAALDAIDLDQGWPEAAE